jgi:hypothetical protein
MLSSFDTFEQPADWRTITIAKLSLCIFKRELGPVERFESALKDKQAARRSWSTG